VAACAVLCEPGRAQRLAAVALRGRYGGRSSIPSNRDARADVWQQNILSDAGAAGRSTASLSTPTGVAHCLVMWTATAIQRARLVCQPPGERAPLCRPRRRCHRRSGIAEHRRVIQRSHGPGCTIYDWRHYLRCCSASPEPCAMALRSQPCPMDFKRLQAVLLRRPGGDGDGGDPRAGAPS